MQSLCVSKKSAHWRNESIDAKIRRNGFTIMELMMVIIILSIALLIVGVNLDSLIPSERMRADAKAIGSLMQFARAEAACKGVNYGIVYDLKNNAYWLLVPRSVNGEYADYNSADELENSEPEVREKLFYKKLEYPVEFLDVQIGEQHAIKNKVVKIEITPLGLASGHIVHLRDKEEKTEFSIELNTLTAAVSYYDHYKEFKEVVDYEE